MSSSLSGDTCRIFWPVLRANPARSLPQEATETVSPLCFPLMPAPPPLPPFLSSESYRLMHGSSKHRFRPLSHRRRQRHFACSRRPGPLFFGKQSSPYCFPRAPHPVLQAASLDSYRLLGYYTVRKRPADPCWAEPGQSSGSPAWKVFRRVFLQSYCGCQGGSKRW